jgi:glutamate--cysteine ligase
MILGGGGDDALERPLRDFSRDELAELFLSAAKPDPEWFIGLELELFVYQQSNLQPVPHDTLAKVLARLGKATGMQESHEPNGALTGLEGKGELVSLEPGGQLEFASSPHRTLAGLRTEVLAYEKALLAAAEPENIGFWALGQQPFVDRNTAPHMPKPRYDQMRNYLGARGARALDMMHLTGSVQCTVDFQNEKNLVDKVRTAARVSPFLSALVAASPFSDGKANGFKSVRYQIWLETDDERCGIWPEMVDQEGFTMRRYVDRTMRLAPMFFVKDGQYVPGGKQSFEHYVREGYLGRDLTVRDYLDHLTSFFPEIRTKAYVEMRGADCVLPTEAVAIGAFWRALLDDEPTRAMVDDRLSAMSYEEIRSLQPQVAKLGLDAVSASGPVRELVTWLTEQAHLRLGRSGSAEADCVVPLVERAHRGLCPADEMLAVAESTGDIRAALDLVKL